jgi:hypothetical protein
MLATAFHWKALMGSRIQHTLVDTFPFPNQSSHSFTVITILPSYFLALFLFVVSEMEPGHDG